MFTKYYLITVCVAGKLTNNKVFCCNMNALQTVYRGEVDYANAFKYAGEKKIKEKEVKEVTQVELINVERISKKQLTKLLNYESTYCNCSKKRGEKDD